MILGSQSTGLSKMLQEPRARFLIAKYLGSVLSFMDAKTHPARYKQVYSDSTAAGCYLPKDGLYRFYRCGDNGVGLLSCQAERWGEAQDVALGHGAGDDFVLGEQHG